MPARKSSCSKQSFIGLLILLSSCHTKSFAKVADSQQHFQGSTEALTPSSLTPDGVKAFLDPLASLVAYIIYIFVFIWNYLMDHPPAAALLAASIAAKMAFGSIETTRATTRLRETFNALNRFNWDNDVIQAREIWSKVRKDHDQNPHAISKFAYDTDESMTQDDKDLHSKIRTTLRTILNEYENLALGVKTGIIDEDYLYRSIKGEAIENWKRLNPLVMAYRHRYSNSSIYIEYEGLADAWSQDLSYSTGNPMKQTTKVQRFQSVKTKQYKWWRLWQK